MSDKEKKPQDNGVPWDIIQDDQKYHGGKGQNGEHHEEQEVLYDNDYKMDNAAKAFEHLTTKERGQLRLSRDDDVHLTEYPGSENTIDEPVYDNKGYSEDDHFPAGRCQKHRSVSDSTTSGRCRRPCVLGIIVAVLVILVAAGIGLYLGVFQQDAGAKTTVAPPLASEFDAEVRLADQTWDARLADSTSPEFKSLKADVQTDVDTIMQQSSLSTQYQSVEVKNFSEGSVMVQFRLKMTRPIPAVMLKNTVIISFNGLNKDILKVMKALDTAIFKLTAIQTTTTTTTTTTAPPTPIPTTTTPIPTTTTPKPTTTTSRPTNTTPTPTTTTSRPTTTTQIPTATTPRPTTTTPKPTTTTPKPTITTPRPITTTPKPTTTTPKPTTTTPRLITTTPGPTITTPIPTTTTPRQTTTTPRPTTTTQKPTTPRPTPTTPRPITTTPRQSTTTPRATTTTPRPTTTTPMPVTTTPLQTTTAGITTTPDVCRNATIAIDFLTHCFDIGVYNQQWPDNSKCAYLATVGACMQALIESTYQVSCSFSDQVVVANENSGVIFVLLGFDIAVCKYDVTTPKPMTTSKDTKTPEVCRNATLASEFIFDCFDLTVFYTLTTDADRCPYLATVGACMQALIESTYQVSCSFSDQVVVANENSGVIFVLLGFDIAVCKYDVTTPKPMTTSKDTKTPEVCRNATLASEFIFDCFDLTVFYTLTTDADRCPFLVNGGDCLESSMEYMYEVTCVYGDQLVLLSENRQLISSYLGFDIAICIVFGTTPPPPTTTSPGTFDTTTPPSTEQTTTGLSAAELCRDGTSALVIVLDCFEIEIFQVQTTDNDRCKYLAVVGNCLELKIEAKHNITCNYSDQVAIVSENSAIISSFLGFDLNKCNFYTTTPPPPQPTTTVPTSPAECRNATLAMAMLFSCFVMTDFQELTTDYDKCLFLRDVGSCLQGRLEVKYNITCFYSDQVALVSAAGPIISSFLGFHLDICNFRRR